MISESSTKVECCCEQTSELIGILRGLQACIFSGKEDLPNIISEGTSSHNTIEHDQTAVPSTMEGHTQAQTTSPTHIPSTNATNSNIFTFPHRPNRPQHLPQVKGQLPSDIIIDPQGLFFCFVCRTHVPGGTSNLNQHLKGKRHALSNRQFASAAQKEAIRAGFLEAAARCRQRDRQREQGNTDENLRANGREQHDIIPRQREASVAGPSSFLPSEGSFRREASMNIQSPADMDTSEAVADRSVMVHEMEVLANHQHLRPHPPNRNNSKLRGSNQRDQRVPLLPSRTSIVSSSKVMVSRQVSSASRSPIQKMDQADSEQVREVSVQCDGNCVQMKHLSNYLMVKNTGNSGVLLTRQQVYEGHGNHAHDGNRSSKTILGVQGTPSRISKVKSDGASHTRRTPYQNVPRCLIIHRVVPPHLLAMARDEFTFRYSGRNVAAMSDSEHERSFRDIHGTGNCG